MPSDIKLYIALNKKKIINGLVARRHFSVKILKFMTFNLSKLAISVHLL